MKKPTMSSQVLAAIAAALACTTASAQLTLPIERPQLKTGDSWVYRNVDNWTRNETSRSAITFVGAENDQWQFRSQRLPDAQPSTFTVNTDYQPCRSMRNSSTAVCAGMTRFPLTEGWKHAYKELPWPNGQGHSSAECVGHGIETVEVPAGKFEAYRIQCKGYWTRIFEGSSSGRFEETTWYAPAVKRSVRHEYNSFGRNGQPDAKNLSELVEFKPAP